MLRSRRVLASVLAVDLLASACGGGDAQETTTESTADETEGTPTTAADDSAGGAADGSSAVQDDSEDEADGIQDDSEGGADDDPGPGEAERVDWLTFGRGRPSSASPASRTAAPGPHSTRSTVIHSRMGQRPTTTPSSSSTYYRR